MANGWLPAIMTKNFLKVLEGFQNDEFLLKHPKCQNDEKSGGSVMTNYLCHNDEKFFFVIMEVALMDILE